MLKFEIIMRYTINSYDFLLKSHFCTMLLRKKNYMEKYDDDIKLRKRDSQNLKHYFHIFFQDILFASETKMVVEAS
jgi:hypothetical protein